MRLLSLLCRTTRKTARSVVIRDRMYDRHDCMNDDDQHVYEEAHCAWALVKLAVGQGSKGGTQNYIEFPSHVSAVRCVELWSSS